MRTSHILAILISGGAMVGLSACSDDSEDTGPGTGGTAATGGTGTGGLAAGTGGTGTGGLAAGTGGAGTGGDAAGTGGTGIVPCATEKGFTAEEAGLAAPMTGVYNYFDEGGSCSDLSADPTTGSGCLPLGVATMIKDGDDGTPEYDLYWGVGLGYSLGEDGATIDATGTTGITFTIDSPPPGLRAGVTVSGSDDSFFSEAVVAGANTILFADMKTGSWVDPAGVLDLTILKDIQFQVPSKTGADVTFEFCISGLTLDGYIGMGGAGGT